MSGETCPTPDEANWISIGRYLSNECDPDEIAAVEAWLTGHAGDAALVSWLAASSDRIRRCAEVAVDTEHALASLRKQILEADARQAASQPVNVHRAVSAFCPLGAPPVLSGQHARIRRLRLIGVGVAAVLTLALALFVRSGGVAAVEFRTAIGQRDSVRLVDGSSVMLAPGSRLVLSSSFGNRNRRVTLEGAAYFDVVHDDALPFVVYAGGVDVRDIGTAFSVKTQPGGGVSVAVAEGVVSLSTKRSGRQQQLRTGDLGVLENDQLVITRGVVTLEDVAWLKGRLSYRDASLGEVRSDLERWYGVHLVIRDSALARRTLTASFSDDSVSQVLRIIALALGADIEYWADTVRLRPRVEGLPTVP